MQNPAFQENVDGMNNQLNGVTYESYQTVGQENPTRSVSTESPVSKGDYPGGRVNPGFLSDSSVDVDNGVHVYPERNGHYVTKSLIRPRSKSPGPGSRKQYSPTEDRELPSYYTPVNAHRKLLR